MEFELIIQNESDVYLPLVEDSIVWKTERKGVSGQLDFKILDDGNLKIEEGNAVSFKVDGEKVFYGFIFTLKRDKEKIISVTCYDQLRYFKNKDTYVYTNKTAGELIKMISEDFEMQCGEIEDTGFKIPSRIEENTTLFDMIQNALDLTLENKKEMYVLYDDFGKITLKNISSMVVEILIDFDTGENFDYSSSIDSETYNKIKLTYDNKDTGKRDVYISQDGNNINKWGVLQYFDTISEWENGNGSLMRILPLALYLFRLYGPAPPDWDKALPMIHNASRLTHAHPISLISCGIYCCVAFHLLTGAALPDAISAGIACSKTYYSQHPDYGRCLDRFSRVDAGVLMALGEDDIQSDGYVLHTLEAALWCLLHTGSYRDCVLTAVNLGSDTDTVAAIAGGLAGISYGEESIPQAWLDVIPKLETIRALCRAFCSHVRAGDVSCPPYDRDSSAVWNGSESAETQSWCD